MTASVARGLYWLGVLLILLAVADALLSRLANIDVTGVQWSPMALGGVGMILTWIARFGSQPDDAES